MKTVECSRSKNQFFQPAGQTGSGQRNHRDLPQWGAGRRSRATQAVNRIKTHPVLSKSKSDMTRLSRLPAMNGRNQRGDSGHLRPALARQRQ